jgi:hypothetical protein
LVERLVYTEDVGSSSLSSPTITSRSVPGNGSLDAQGFLGQDALTLPAHRHNYLFFLLFFTTASDSTCLQNAAIDTTCPPQKQKSRDKPGFSKRMIGEAIS